MKPIQITQEQKDKLLEMCKTLFPEYNFWFTSENGNSDTRVTNFISLDFNTHIHWFEFCCNTELIEKVLNDGSMSDHLTNDASYYLEQCIGFKNEHPIDYLYEHFKELKK